MFWVRPMLECRKIAWISLSSIPSACRFVARPRRKACQPCHLQTGAITRWARLLRFNGCPLPAAKIGKSGCARIPARSLCASSASANGLTTGTGARDFLVFGSFSTLFQTERRTNNSLPSKSAQRSPRISPLRSPVRAAQSTTVRAGSSSMASMALISSNDSACVSAGSGALGIETSCMGLMPSRIPRRFACLKTPDRNDLRCWGEHFRDGRGHAVLCAVFPAIGNGQFLADRLSFDRAIRLLHVVTVTHEPALIAMEHIPFLLSHEIVLPNSLGHGQGPSLHSLR